MLHSVVFNTNSPNLVFWVSRVVDILLLQTVSLGVASASIVIGVIYYILQLRHQITIRKTDLMIRLYSWVQSREYMDSYSLLMRSQSKDYEDYVKKYGSILSFEAPMHRALLSVLAPYEMVGTLLYRKRIDLGFIYDVFGSTGSKILYEKLMPIIVGIRRDINEPGLFVGFEYVHDELLRKEPQLRKTLGKYLSQPISDAKSSNQSSR
jgi:hypothetical protein